MRILSHPPTLLSASPRAVLHVLLYDTLGIDEGAVRVEAATEEVVTGGLGFKLEAAAVGAGDGVWFVFDVIRELDMIRELDVIRERVPHSLDFSRVDGGEEGLLFLEGDSRRALGEEGAEALDGSIGGGGLLACV